jgi:hypothetical protein
MIQFFRNIRKKILAKGKIRNYLMYAIGEIVLVVIGILIALSIITGMKFEKIIVMLNLCSRLLRLKMRSISIKLKIK